MAHGLPDYYRGVDIAYQSLARLMSRPTYGPFKELSSIGPVSAGETKTLATVTGKGMIYGGFFRVWHTASQKDSKARLNIDGETTVTWAFEDMYNYRIAEPGMTLTYLRLYDDANYHYVTGITPGITFETSFDVIYQELSGNDTTLFYHLLYALIT